MTAPIIDTIKMEIAKNLQGNWINAISGIASQIKADLLC